MQSETVTVTQKESPRKYKSITSFLLVIIPFVAVDFHCDIMKLQFAYGSHIQLIRQQFVRYLLYFSYEFIYIYLVIAFVLKTIRLLLKHYRLCCVIPRETV